MLHVHVHVHVHVHCMSVRNLSLQNGANRELIRTLGGLAPLLRIVAQGAPPAPPPLGTPRREAAYRAAGALENLAADNGDNAAAIVEAGVVPAMKELLIGFGTADLSQKAVRKGRESLPETFCVGEVVETEVIGAMINVKLKLTWIGSKSAAIAAIAQGKDPTLDSGAFACLGVKFNMRELPTVTGTVAAAKANDICPHVLTFGDWVAVAGITPRDHTDTGVVCVFPSGYAVGMIPSIKRICAKVDEAYVLKELAGGATQYVYDTDPDVPVLKDKEGNALTVAMPQLGAHGYQEITGSSFKFALARMPAGKPSKEYYVWWKESPELIADDPDIACEIEAGKKAVLAAAAAKGTSAATGKSLTINEFLMTYGLIYVVATE